MAVDSVVRAVSVPEVELPAVCVSDSIAEFVEPPTLYASNTRLLDVSVSVSADVVAPVTFDVALRCCRYRRRSCHPYSARPYAIPM